MFSQNNDKIDRIDSLTQHFKKDSAHIYRFKKIRPFGSLDNRNSFIKDAPVNVKGLQLGLIVNNKHTFGFGYYTIRENAKQNITTKNEKNISAKRTLGLNYLTLFYQYAIIDKRYFELDLPFEFGLGSYHLRLEDTITHKNILPDKNGGTIISGTGVNIIIKPLKWIGISGTAGYRIALDNNPNINFSGAYYSYGVWINVQQIYRDIKFYGFARKKYRKRVAKLLAEK